MNAKQRKALAILLLGLSALGAVIWWKSRPRLSDKEQITLVINQLKDGIENKSPREVMAHISREYNDSAGMNHPKAYALSRRLLRESGRVEIDITDYEGPIIDGDFAEMKLTVRATAFSGQSPAATIQGDVEILFFRERKGWKVLNSEGWHQWVLGIE